MTRFDRGRKAAYAIEAMLDPPSDPGPIVAADTWRQVVTRAGGQCECRECAARNHPKAQGRCSRTGGLHAVPREPAFISAGREPVYSVAAMRLPAASLMALCDSCHGAALARARKAQEASARRALAQAPALFGDDDRPETSS
jgi:hypothetical protein